MDLTHWVVSHLVVLFYMLNLFDEQQALRNVKYTVVKATCHCDQLLLLQTKFSHTKLTSVYGVFLSLRCRPSETGEK